MALVSLQNVALSFVGTPILDNVSLQIEKNQRICLLGRNGSGKTSLLRTLAGEIQPDSGFVQKASDVRVSYFAQNIPPDLDGDVFAIIASALGEKGELILQYHQAEQSLDENAGERMAELREKIDAADGWSFVDEIGRVTSHMGIGSDWVYENLSGGQKRRVLLAAALVAKPDVLLLDEPTNHLDIDTIAWLEDFLLKTTITIVFVTHDRMLLRRLANRIIELDRGQLYDWECDYDTFLARKEELLFVEQKDWDRFDKKLALEETWIRKGIRARRTRNEGRVRALKKMREERRQRRNRVGTAKMQISTAQNSGKDVIIAENISFAYDHNPVIKDFSLKVERGEKIGVVGANGCGKTTLIKLLTGSLQPDSGTVSHGTNLEIVYYDQLRAELDEQKNVWENVLPHGDTVLVNGKDVHIITYLQNFLFSPERAKSKVSILSGGERNRVLLARLFATPANLLVLDEPTNDLDIETLELLEELLVEFKGTVLLICHDRTFLDNLVDSTIVFAENGEVKEIVGGYEDWMNERKAEELQQQKAEKAKKAAERAESQAASKVAVKLSFKEKQELESLPELIEKSEQEMEQIDEQLSDPEFYKSGSDASALTTRRNELEENLMHYLERWEILEQKEITSQS